MLGEYTNKKMAATSPCQLQNNTMIETRCYPSSVLCIRLWQKVTISFVYGKLLHGKRDLQNKVCGLL